METDFMLVRHSMKKEPVLVTFERKGYDLTNYTFLRMHPPSEGTVAEWVWTEDLEFYQKFFGLDNDGN